MLRAASSHRRNTCPPAPGWASSMDELMSGNTSGTRPYTAWYGVLPSTPMSALPANTHTHTHTHTLEGPVRRGRPVPRA
eukprot:7241751-Alexandrium_andersonii.AAC.1